MDYDSDGRLMGDHEDACAVCGSDKDSGSHRFSYSDYQFHGINDDHVFVSDAAVPA